MPMDDHTASQARPDRPIIALLGEFSAGKSTLLNVLLREARSPVRVTATQVPPVWYSFGDGPAIHVAKDGTETALLDNDLANAPLRDTRAIRVQVEADILQSCDLLDMPGSSDPNMTPDIWDALLPLAHGAIWCTPATQAWRQSEAAIWEDVTPDLQARSLLLLTRVDKILNPEDRTRLLARVRREAQGYFRSVHPVALLKAAQGLSDPDAWSDSGMAEALDAVHQVLAEIAGAPPRPVADVVPLAQAAGSARPEAMPEAGPEAAPKPAGVVMPRRVKRTGGRAGRGRIGGADGSLL